MNTTIINPPFSEWEVLCKRPEIQSEDLTQRVQEILDAVRTAGDVALQSFTLQFDQVKIDVLKVAIEEISTSAGLVSSALQEAIRVAYQNIYSFHQAQLITEPTVETMPGVTCWRKNVGIENVGLYIPGGTAPLFSTLLMLGIPAKIAGCKRLVLCTPPDKQGNIHPAILYVASLLGISEIYKVGGAQAIAALAFGTETIPKVDKIFGPGNQYMTKAKAMVQQYGVAIDLPAGPSEVLVVADNTADSDFVASDLLAQAEHGIDSQVVLVSNSRAFIEKVQSAIVTQLAKLPRKDIAEKALAYSRYLFFDSIETCMEFSNYYAPEHLILAVADSEVLAQQVLNAGSVFLGNYSCESAGDYASGTNHTLPTHGYAKSYSGVSVDSFLKKITFQHLTKEGLLALGGTIETMAANEDLIAHKNAVTIRINKINYGQ